MADAPEVPGWLNISNTHSTGNYRGYEVHVSRNRYAVKGGYNYVTNVIVKLPAPCEISLDISFSSAFDFLNNLLILLTKDETVQLEHPRMRKGFNVVASDADRACSLLDYEMQEKIVDAQVKIIIKDDNVWAYTDEMHLGESKILKIMDLCVEIAIKSQQI